MNSKHFVSGAYWHRWVYFTLTRSSRWLWLTQECLARKSNFWVKMAKRWALMGKEGDSICHGLSSHSFASTQNIRNVCLWATKSNYFWLCLIAGDHVIYFAQPPEPCKVPELKCQHYKRLQLSGMHMKQQGPDYCYNYFYDRYFWL